MQPPITSTGGTEPFTSTFHDKTSAYMYTSTDISGVWIRYYAVHAVAFAGSASNILALFVVAWSRRMRSSPSGVLLLSLSAIDTLVLITERIETLTHTPLGNRRIALTRTSLTIVTYLKYTGRCTASFIITCISINRFAVVVYPLKSKWFLQWRNAFVQVAISVILSAILNTFVLFYPPINNTGTGGYFYGIILVEIIFSDFLLSLVIIILSGCTAYTFLQSGKNIRRNSKTLDWAAHKKSTERQVTVLLLTVAFTYVVLRMQYKVVWIPVFFLHHFKHHSLSASLRMAYYVTYCIYLLNYATNLYQYCLCSSVFRSEFRRLFSCYKHDNVECRKVSVSSGSGGAKSNTTGQTSLNHLKLQQQTLL